MTDDFYDIVGTQVNRTGYRPCNSCYRYVVVDAVLVDRPMSVCRRCQKPAIYCPCHPNFPSHYDPTVELPLSGCAYPNCVSGQR